MRKHMISGLVLGLLLLMPAVARAQLNGIQPADFTAFLSHSGYDQGGWFFGTDFLFMNKLFGNYNGSSPSSILSFGYRTQDDVVYQFSWWDQWFSDNTGVNNSFEVLEFSGRFKTYDNGCYRQFGVLGARGVLVGQNFPFKGGLNYSVDNNMVGPYIGCMNEWYLGSNPLGAFSFTLDGDVGAYADFIRQAAGSAGGSNVFNQFTLSGTLQGKAGFIWYIWEGLTIHAGLEVLSIINLQQPSTPPAVVNNSIDARLSPTMPVFIGVYFGLGFVF